VTKTEVLRRHVLELIETSMAPHEKLPTEREFAEQFSVSRLTVRQMLGRLESEGRVYRAQGSGTFVSEPRIAKSLELTSFSEDMRARGLKPGSQEVTIERKPAGANVGFALQMSPRDDVIHVSRVRFADDVPMCIENSFVPVDVAPGLLEHEIDGSLYSLLENRFQVRLDRAEQTIRVTTLEPHQAKLLQTAEFSAAFDVQRVSIDARGRRIEYAQSIYRGDRYSYELTVYRSARTNSDLNR
jgi:GntR family transcriptional regulator